MLNKATSITFAILLTVVGSITAAAQELEISVSPSPVGSGARAAGMADAFVAIADDASAASWNPAGLIQLEVPEIAIVGSYNGIYEGFSADYHDEVDSWHRDNAFNLNFLSVTYPLPFTVLDRNIVVGLYYQHKYDFTRNFKLQFNSFSVAPGNSGLPGIVTNNYLDMDFKQEGQIATISPGIALELTHKLSLGVALNLWRSTWLSDNTWTQDLKTSTFSQSAFSTTFTSTKSHDEYKDLTGTNWSIGLLYDMNEKWSFGARYDTAWTGRADFERRSFTQNFPIFGGGTPFFINGYTKEPRDIRFPATIALGAAYRPNDRLTLALDVSRTDWNDFWFKGRSGSRISLVDASNLDNVIFAKTFDPTYTVRFGFEYVFVPKQPDEVFKRLWSMRGGVFYDQEPATGAPDNFYGFAVGVGCLINENINIDLAYQMRYGDDVNADFIRGIRGYDEDVVQNRVLLSTVIYFDRAFWRRNKRVKE